MMAPEKTEAKMAKNCSGSLAKALRTPKNRLGSVWQSFVTALAAYDDAYAQTRKWEQTGASNRSTRPAPTPDLGDGADQMFLQSDEG